MSNKRPNPDIRFFNELWKNKASEKEKIIFWKWLWILELPVFAAQDTDEVIRQRMLQKILEQVSGPVQSSVVKLQWIRYAAIILLVITGGTAGWLLLNHNSTASASSTIVSNNNRNLVKYVLLPDSSQVYLNAFSSIEYGDDYNLSERTIKVKGEACFMVHANSNKPFKVQSGNISTLALGTAFTVENIAGESEVRILLTEGKVAVSKPENSKPFILQPGQLFRYNRRTGDIRIAGSAADATAWTNGGLVFNGIPLSEALDRISRRYGLQLQYNTNELKGLTVTASFRKTSWQNVLSNILFVHNLHYTQKNGKVLIR